MNTTAHHLARISRGEQGKTAYFAFPSVEEMPETITHLWDDSVETTHRKGIPTQEVQETLEIWWDKYVKNEKWPGQVLTEDIFNDVFLPLYTVTTRYSLESSKNVKKTKKPKKGAESSSPHMHLEELIVQGTAVGWTPLGIIPEKLGNDSFIAKDVYFTSQLLPTFPVKWGMFSSDVW